MKLNKKLDKKITRSEKNIAAIISISIMAAILACYFIFIVNSANKEAQKSLMINTVTDGYVILPSGIQLKNNESLSNYIMDIMKSDSTKKEKEEVLEYLELQNIDTTEYVAYLNGETNITLDNNESTDTESDIYKDFLVDNGIIDENTESDVSDSKLNILNGKAAKSYRNLHEAETAFGNTLGLYFYCDSLPNYEMVSAYTVGDEFLQCVYAINQDGTALSSEQDIEESEIKTITVKLSVTMNIKDMISVYEDYDIQQKKLLDDTDIYYAGNEENIINLIYCERSDFRKYAIHCADGIEFETAENLMYELFSNLNYYN